MCIMNAPTVLAVENLNNSTKRIYILDKNTCFFGAKDVVEGYKEQLFEVIRCSWIEDSLSGCQIRHRSGQYVHGYKRTGLGKRKLIFWINITKRLSRVEKGAKHFLVIGYVWRC